MSSSGLPLPLNSYQRYGRQMILDEFGLDGQIKLQNASVVVVGAGGLGCPALQYLAAAGVGRIGIVDHDTVELSNLQRQILHTEANVGLNKTVSASKTMLAINSSITIDVHPVSLDSSNASKLLSPYSVILDCTDNAPTRYLLSDNAVFLKKPLISGAAQKFEGQLCIYNKPMRDGSRGPCYRCLFPIPPASENVGTCEELGILGAVTGIIGNMQALEAIKLLTDISLSDPPNLLLFNALSMPQFRSVKLRSKKPQCLACGTPEAGTVKIQETDYVQFCGGPRPDWVSRGLSVDKATKHRITAKDLKAVLSNPDKAVNLIDVRPRTEYGICNLPGFRHVSLSSIVADPSAYLPANAATSTYVVCRLGNDSQIAAEALRDVQNEGSSVQDVVGGLGAWSRDVDSEFPVY